MKEDVYDIPATIVPQILMGIAKLMILIKWLNSCDFHTCLEIEDANLSYHLYPPAGFDIMLVWWSKSANVNI